MNGALHMDGEGLPTKDLGTFAIGETTFSVSRGLNSIQVLVFMNERAEPRWFCTGFPLWSEDDLALHWALDMVVKLGAWGECVLIRRGSVEHNQLQVVAMATNAIHKASGVCP